MSTIAPRLSPVHHLLEARGAQWGRLGDSPIALRFGPDEDERAALPILGLCDVSALRKLGIRGPGAGTWLGERGVELPPAVYDTLPLAHGGLVVRLDRKSTRLNSSHITSSYAVFCLKKKIPRRTCARCGRARCHQRRT